MVEIAGVCTNGAVTATDICGYTSSRDLDILKKEDDLLPISTSSIKQRIIKFWQGEILWDCSMKKFSTLRVGGPATAVVLPSSEEEVALLIRGLQQNNIPWRVIGKGSNILVPDEGFSGVVIVFGSRFSKINKVACQGDKNEVHVDAGCGLAKLCNWCTENELSGLEFLAGIPGSVGGAISMNAGAWGKEISDSIRSINFINKRGKTFSLDRQELYFSYRHLDKERGSIILSAVFELYKGHQDEIASKCQEYMKQRKENQPQWVASAGSFFKNPAGNKAAGFLIEKSGLKGFRVGGAMVSDVHANFIVNTGDATAQNLFELMRIVQKKVKGDFDVYLEPEVDIWPAMEN